MLHGVAPHDPLTLGLVPVVLVVVAAAASWIPAWRATRVSPLLALRSE
jgi:ABC-type lipoprotein release transport system permease subunit